MSNKGFTLIELIIVIVLLGILAVTAAPKFLSLSSDARIASLESVKASMQTSIDLVKVKGRIAGLTPLAENPGDTGQANFIINFGIGSAEVDFRNLCPESQGELGDALDMEDFLDLGEGLESDSTNQYTFVGFELPSPLSPSNPGCYILYDSFGFPDCTLTIVSDNC